MIKSLVSRIFGCAHNRTTFPLTPSRNSRAFGRGRSGAYIVCLDCGKEFDYDWHEMRVTMPIPQHRDPIFRRKQRAAQ